MSLTYATAPTAPLALREVGPSPPKAPRLLDRVREAQNQALSALLFLYREVLQQDLPWLDDVVRARRPVRQSRHPNRPRASWSSRRQHHDDLHACSQSRARGCPKPGGRDGPVTPRLAQHRSSQCPVCILGLYIRAPRTRRRCQVLVVQHLSSSATIGRPC